MKMAIKRENDEFFVITLKHVSSLTVVLNLHKTENYGQYLMNMHKTENYGQYLMNMAIKRENDEVLVINLKPVLGLMVVVNRPRIPKLWVIAHENRHKERKRQVFGHNSQALYRVLCLL